MDFTSLTTIILVTFLIIGSYLIFTNQIEGRSKMILIVALLIIFIILISLPMFQSYTTLVSSPQDAMTTYSIPASSFTGTNLSNYSLSSWIYVNDWNVNYGQKKNIITSNDGICGIQLDEYDNNLTITFNTYGDSASITHTSQSIHITNVSIQKWVNITVCFGDNTVDTYINGKLVNSFVTNGTQYVTSPNPGYTIGMMPSVGGNAAVSGFNGSLSNVRYYGKLLTPQDAWDIYNAGFGKNMFSSFLNQYGAKFTFYKSGAEIGRMSIL